MKKLPIDERKVSTTFALSLKALEKLDEIQERFFPGKSRSYAVEEIITILHNRYITEEDEIPDNLSEVEKQKLNSVYGEVHHVEQTDQV